MTPPLLVSLLSIYKFICFLDVRYASLILSFLSQLSQQLELVIVDRNVSDTSDVQTPDQRKSVTGPPLWSSGEKSWLQIQRPGFFSRRYQIF
jgi:hypothetical protein